MLTFNWLHSVQLIYHYTGADALYEWSCSPLDASTNRFALPNLGDLTDENIASIAENLDGLEFRNAAIVYPVPSTLNCSGTVSAVEYCYRGPVNDIVLGREYSVFTLLMLEQNGLNFTVDDIFDIRSIPTLEVCTERDLRGTIFQICCDSFPLDMTESFNLPTASNFAFGLIESSFPAQLLRYNVNAFPEFLVDRFRSGSAVFGRPLRVGNSFTLFEGNLGAFRALRVLQLVIGKNFMTMWAELLCPEIQWTSCNPATLRMS